VPAHGHRVSDWSAPVNLGAVVNSSAGDFFPAVSKDELSLYFTSARVAPGAQGGWDTVFFDRQPSIRRDGLEIFFASNRPVDGVDRLLDLWVSSRATPWDPWGIPVNLQLPVNSGDNDAGPALSFDGKTLYFHTLGAVGAFDLFMTTRSRLRGKEEDD
jgi:hypothetical protein